MIGNLLERPERLLASQPEVLVRDLLRRLLQPGFRLGIDAAHADRLERRRRRVGGELFERALRTVACDRAHQRCAIARKIVDDANGVRLEDVQRDALVRSDLAEHLDDLAAGLCLIFEARIQPIEEHDRRRQRHGAVRAVGVLVGWERLRGAHRWRAASSRRRCGCRAGWPRDVDLKELDLLLLAVLEHLEVSRGEVGDRLSIPVVHEDVERDETRRQAEWLTIWLLSPDRRRCIQGEEDGPLQHRGIVAYLERRR